MPEADLKSVHKTLGSDLSLETMGLEYEELLRMENTQLVTLRESSLSQKVKVLAQSEHYKTANKVLARVLAAKPHSADVERLISCSNNLKSPDRSSMHVETENLYLYIHYNMPPVYLWDPRLAVVKWLNNKSHRVVTRHKGKQQNYFRGVFPEADNATDTYDIDSSKGQVVQSKSNSF